MFAVIKTGGLQYRVAADDVVTVGKIKGEPGEIVQFPDVLLLGGDTVVIGAPSVAGASVAGEVLKQTRGPKVIAFKKRRRKNSRRKRGHRQDLTVVRITEILTDGQQPTKPAQARAEPAPKPEIAAEAGEPAAADRPAPAAEKKPRAARAKAAPAKPKAPSAKPKAKPATKRKKS